MAHEFGDLYADLEAAKADLARSVKRCRSLVGDRRAPKAEPGKSAFGWGKSEQC